MKPLCTVSAIAVVAENKLAIRSPYNGEMIEQFRQVHGRIWNPHDQRWEFPLSEAKAVIEILLHHYPAASVPLDLPEEAPFGELKRLNDDTITISSVEYDSELYSQIKEGFRERKWDMQRRWWEVKVISFGTINLLCKLATQFNLTTPPEVKALLQVKEEEFEVERKAKEEAIAASSALTAEIEIAGLKGQLMPFQKAAVEYVEGKGGRVLIADDMGLGKTVEALAWCQLHPEKRPVVVVCPKNVKYSWYDHIKSWLPPEITVTILNGGPDARSQMTLLASDFLVVNYDVLAKWEVYLKKMKPQVVVLDESHYIKSSWSKRSGAAVKLCEGVPHVLALSGTPMMNRPIELWTTANIIVPGLLGKENDFAFRYCGAKWGEYGMEYGTPRHLDELQALVRAHFMIRRTKDQALPDLPPKMRHTLPFDLENRAEYDHAHNDFRSWLLDQLGGDKLAWSAALRAEILVQIEKLKQLAVKGKLSQVIEFIEDFMLGSNDKLVVFAHHAFVLDAILHRFPGSVSIRGGDDDESRRDAVLAFQTDSAVRLIVCSLTAAGIGITLTAASHVLMVEYGWNPAVMNQAADRLHRIGQKESVMIHYCPARQSIEQWLEELIQSKEEIIKNVMDVDAEGVTEDMMKLLVKRFIDE